VVIPLHGPGISTGPDVTASHFIWELPQLIARIVPLLRRTFLNSNLFTFNLKNYRRHSRYYVGTSNRGLAGLNEEFFLELVEGQYVDFSDEPIDMTYEDFVGLELNISISS
jgi:hypothetical protein